MKFTHRPSVSAARPAALPLAVRTALLSSMLATTNLPAFSQSAPSADPAKPAPAVAKDTAKPAAPADTKKPGSSSRAPVERITVTAGQRGAAALARAEERDATQTVSVISADDAGQFGDQNIAEGLQRLPGLNVIRDEGEGRSVSVRGLAPSFTQVTINGVRLGATGTIGSGPISGDNETNAVALDLVSVDMLSRAAVFKTFTADMDGDTIGGAIDLKTVSAFDSKKNFITGRLEASHGEYSGKTNPKGSVSFARLLGDNGVFGISGSISHFQRKILGDQLRNELGIAGTTFNNTTTPASGVAPFNNSGRLFLYPNRLNPRVEAGERERSGATLNLEYRSGDGTEAFLRTQYSRLRDDDIRIEEQWNTDRANSVAGNRPTANGVEILESEVGPGFGVFRDVRYRARVYFQPTIETTSTMSLGGQHLFGNTLVKAQFDSSRSRSDLKDAVRGRYEIDDIVATATWGEDYYTATRSLWPRFTAGSANDPAVLANYRLNALLAANELKKDDVNTARVDLQHTFEASNNWFTAIKGGFKIRDRTNTADRTEFDTLGPVSLANAGITGNLSQIANFFPGTQYASFGPFPALNEARPYFLSLRNQLQAFYGSLSPNPSNLSYLRRDSSVGRDYRIEEKVEAAYVLAELEPQPGLEVSAGVRIERTKFGSQGFFFEADADTGNATPTGGAPIVIPLASVNRNYSNVLPSVVARWELRPDLLLRASYGQGIKRSDFKDSANRMQITTGLDPDTGVLAERELEAGNPNLKPLKANQYDLGLAWFPDKDTSLQVSLFHKDMRDFFVRFTGNASTFGLSGVTLPSSVSPLLPIALTRVLATLNGGKAKVSGIEVGFSKNFTELPGLASGLFVQGNATFADSRADVSYRPNEALPFPDQADRTINLSIGWENPDFSIRLTGNHVSKRIFQISTSPGLPTASRFNGEGGGWEPDIYRAPYSQLDINLRWNINKRVQLYFDGTNLTREKEVRYWNSAGVAGLDRNFFERVEDFGSTYQIGLRAKF